MKEIKYTVIKSKRQYKEYCLIHEQLLETKGKNKGQKEELELLIFLIEKWDEEHNNLKDMDPIVLLNYLMAENDLKAKDLVEILNVSKGLVSDILNYKKGISKDIIRTLAEYFSVSQEAFNRPYNIVSPYNSKLRDARVMNSKKVIA